MKYVCLGYQDEDRLARLPAIERLALIRECRAFYDELSTAGYLLKGSALPPSGGALLLKIDAGRVVVREGPLAAGGEQLGGVLLLEARDLNSAVRIMSGLPALRAGGALELRRMSDQ